MNKAFCALGLLSILLAAAAQAQGVQFPYERVLVPIMAQSVVPGAFGSLWTTQLIVRNESDQFVEISYTIAGCAIECPPGRAPRSTFGISDFLSDPNGGEFLYIGAPGKGKVSFSLRVQDLSRQSQTWGSAIPVVHESDTFTSTLQLLDVPVDSRFRSALRVYDFGTAQDYSGSAVRVRIYTMCGIGPIDGKCADSPLVDTLLNLSKRGSDFANPSRPGAAMVGNLAEAFPQLANVQPTVLPFGQLRPATVRIVIDPVSPDLRFWAFVSTTNNETQHVTVIVPH